MWRCYTRVEQGPTACDALTVQEEELQMATVKAINLAMRCSASMQDILCENIEQVVRADQTDEKLAELNEILITKQRELAALVKEKKDYSALADDLDVLRAQKQEILVEKAQTEGYKMRIQEMGTLLEEHFSELTEYDESMVRSYIQGIRIYDDKFTISFKARINLDIQR